MCEPICLYSVHPPPPPQSAGEVEPPTKFSREGDLFERGGGCNFYKKNKLTYEIFNHKKDFFKCSF